MALEDLVSKSGQWIDVKQEDLDNGLWRNPSYCPIALAINRAIGIDSYQVSVTGNDITIRLYHPGFHELWYEAIETEPSLVLITGKNEMGTIYCDWWGTVTTFILEYDNNKDECGPFSLHVSLTETVNKFASQPPWGRRR